MTSLGATEISVHWSLTLLTGQPYVLSQAGLRPFIWLLLTCPRQRSRCFLLYMPFSMVYKTMSAKHWQIFPTLHHINWQTAWSSDYYYRSDESPYYTWAACMLYIFPNFVFFTDHWLLSPVLDPCIMYEGLRRDCALDGMLLTDLNNARDQLKTFYNKNYANRTRRPPVWASQLNSSFSSASGSAPHSPEKVNLTSCYQREDRVIVNELDEFYKLPREDFDSWNPWNGGLGDAHNFLTSIALCATFSRFRVRLSWLINFLSSFWLPHYVPQVLQLPLSIYFQGGMILFLYDVPASFQIPSESWCWSRIASGSHAST